MSGIPIPPVLPVLLGNITQTKINHWGWMTEWLLRSFILCFTAWQKRGKSLQCVWWWCLLFILPMCFALDRRGHVTWRDVNFYNTFSTTEHAPLHTWPRLNVNFIESILCLEFFSLNYSEILVYSTLKSTFWCFGMFYWSVSNLWHKYVLCASNKPDKRCKEIHR